MFLNFIKKEEDGRETVDLSAELDRSDKKCAFLLLAARALLQCTREFALDVKELDTPAFKAGLGELAERLAAEEKLSRVEALFESRKSGISTFAQRQKDYLREPCFAAWVVTLCPDREFVMSNRPAIEKVITHYDFSRVYLSQFFPVESAWWRMRLMR